MDFCFDDGARLHSANVSADLPTLVIPPLATRSTTPREKGNLIYVGIGVMATAIVALVSVLAYIAYIPTEKDTNQDQTARVDQKSDAKTSTSSSNTTPVNKPAQTPEDEPSLPPLTEAAAEDVIDRWVKAQNDRNFTSYRNCYSPTFRGKKRTTNSEKELSYDQWMRDRRAMMPNLISVQAVKPIISIEGNNTATVKFVQNFRSERHCDIGEKTLVIKMFSQGPKIVWEDLANVQDCR